tara:strand:+ start:1255 stop:1971 length:717 start_codon:yes stop_codon:yes gene_type:complete
MKFVVYIPSKGRAGKVTTHKLFKESIIVCPKSEVKEYKKHHENVLGVDDNIKGITKTRNWILNHNKEKYQIQVDDDALSFHGFENGKAYKFIEPERIERIIETQFDLCEGWGLKAFGFALAADYKFYREFNPFSTQSVIGANILGIIKNPLRFDERLVVKEDYDYSMQHIAEYGGVLRLNKYGIDVIHLTNEGGCVSYRTKEVEMDAYNVLLKKWGNKVVKLQPNKNFVKMRSPRKGV